jgi:hypothetical protein
LVAPPRVTVITMSLNGNAHLNPALPDRYRYVLVTNRVSLLIHFSADPFHGVQFNIHPDKSYLILVRKLHHLPEAEAQEGEMMPLTATIELLLRHRSCH